MEGQLTAIDGSGTEALERLCAFAGANFVSWGQGTRRDVDVFAIGRILGLDPSKVNNR
ncbi:hypothetical protein [Rhodococcus sovatensis]|uniref:Uncharacterized protein n=1 Tax=Rhodococcus sovatensis TaxID=1805840 RepID=A0ABZ2PRM6_9NOCA